MDGIDSNNISAIIGVLGTLAGVILGTILNKFDRIGKIKIFQNSLNVKFTERGASGAENKTTRITDRTDSLSIELNFDFYNTSALSPKIARDIKLVFRTKAKTIKEKLKNENTRKYSQYTSHADDLLNVNLSPKEILNYNLSYHSRENFQEILDAEWFLEYRKNNNKLKRIQIAKQLGKKSTH